MELKPISHHELARLAIKVLDKQKEYFKNRNRDVLIASKALERKLYDEAQIVLDTPELGTQIGGLV